jgi:hypothetical protein
VTCGEVGFGLLFLRRLPRPGLQVYKPPAFLGLVTLMTWSESKSIS